MKKMYTPSSLVVMLLSVMLLTGLMARGQVRLPKILGNNMVLQRDKQLPIWGWAEPGTKVTVAFAGKIQMTTAAPDSSWQLQLPAMKASSEPRDMVISAGLATTLHNILVGEVWLCSGQSNMEYTMKLGAGYAKPKKGIDSAELELPKTHPGIRLFKVEKVLSLPDVTSSGWNECEGKALEQFSAVGFYFARNIRQSLDVPVGIIASSWGGSRIEPWTPAEGYAALPAFANEAASLPLMIDSVLPGKDYRSMIQPLAPFALRGFLWYQGESNCMINDGMRYADKMEALVLSWRKQWKNNSLPFYAVQIAPYYYTKRKDKMPHTTETEAEFWEAQVQSTKIPNTALVAVTDLVDNLSDIHPPYKWEVGRRLALIALVRDYHLKMEDSGPEFKRMTITGNKIFLSYNHARGLQNVDGKALSWFTIAGADGKFIQAEAEIKGEQVVVSAVGLKKPAAVRFAWDEAAMPNLFNSAGLPAIPFRTDGITWKKATISK